MNDFLTGDPWLIMPQSGTKTFPHFQLVQSTGGECRCVLVESKAGMEHKITKCLWCIVLDLLKRWIPFVFMVIPISEIVISCFWLQENVAGMGGWEGWNTIQDYATLLTSTHQAATNTQWKCWRLNFSNTIKVIKPPLIHHQRRRQYKFCKRCIYYKNNKNYLAFLDLHSSS